MHSLNIDNETSGQVAPVASPMGPQCITGPKSSQSRQAMQEWLTVPEVASLLRVNRSTVWRWCWAGKFGSAFQAGCAAWRIARTEIERMINIHPQPDESSKKTQRN
jgi:excisionase family DNA binding protein